MKPLLSLVVVAMIAVPSDIQAFPQWASAQKGRVPRNAVERVHPAKRYGELLHNTAALFAKLKPLCQESVTPVECAAVADQGRQLIAQAVEKRRTHLLVEPEKINFHKQLKATLLQTSKVLGDKVPSNFSAFQVPGGWSSENCMLCGDVYHQAVEICALYVIVSPTAAAICVAVASVAYVDCVDKYCTTILTDNGYGFYNDAFYDEPCGGDAYDNIPSECVL